MLLRLVAAALLTASVAAAKKPPQAQEMERAEIARGHFAAAEQLFAGKRYREAVVEYEMAQISFPSQSVDLQIARCYDRLGQPQPAIQAYQRYLAANAEAPDSAEAKERILALRDRAPSTPPPLPLEVVVERPAARQWAAPIAVAGLGVALLSAGGALTGAARADFDRLRAGCAPRCALGEVDALRTRDQAGVALLALGGVALAVDVVLWVVSARRPRVRAAVLPAMRAAVSW